MNIQSSLEILLIEDNSGDALLVEMMLSDLPLITYSLTRADNLAEAIELLQKHEYDAALLDMSLPDGEGLEIITQLKPYAPGLPIIVMTGRQDEEFALQTVKEGVQDYLIKGRIDSWQLTRSLSYAIERKRLEDQMIHLAHHDQLTGLTNRVLFQDRLQQSINRAERRQENFALLYLDLDNFKSINDALGHHVGDKLLKGVADRLLDSTRESDTVARLGGDEFAIILDNLVDTAVVTPVVEKIMDTIAKPFLIGEHTLHAGISIGISLFPDSGRDAENLIKNADSAMYRGKRAGRGQYSYYTSDMNAKALGDLQMEMELRDALEKRELVLCYQPKIELLTQEIVSVEALIRWQHPKRGMIPPADFIPLAEETGLIIPIGEWVLEEACRQLAGWQNMGFRSLRMAVNISARQLRNPDIIKVILSAIDKAGISPGELEIEITESMLMEDTEVNNLILRELRQHDIRVSMDDFGTGYSSLSYLNRFNIDTLKIDRSFVRDIPVDADSIAIATAIVALGKSLRLNVIAEGVETEEQYDFFTKMDCDGAQGFYFSKPLPANEFLQFFESYNEKQIMELSA
ncbi:MAG: EAL domain-containing protein [Gammaproteobacteria bacterium]|nr:EAL domain-containing protein [Gammaproteobacteria bacterium]